MFRTRRRSLDGTFRRRVLYHYRRSGPRRTFSSLSFSGECFTATPQGVHLYHPEGDDQFVLWSRPLRLACSCMVIVTPPSPPLVLQFPVFSSQTSRKNHRPDGWVPRTIARRWASVERASRHWIGENNPKVGSPCRRRMFDSGDQRADVEFLGCCCGCRGHIVRAIIELTLGNGDIISNLSEGQFRVPDLPSLVFRLISRSALLR
jgi:hypothetical protein